MTDANMTDLEEEDLVREFICVELVDRIIDEVPRVRRLIVAHYRNELRELWLARKHRTREPSVRELVDRRRRRRI